VLHHFHEQELTLVGADGFRLAARTIALDQVALPGEEPELQVLVPARALGELVKILPEPSPSADDPPIGLSLAAQRNHLVYHTAFCQFAVRLMEGHYPNYTRIIEQAQGGPTRATVATSELRKALQIAAHFAREDNHTVRLTLTPPGPQSPGQVLLQATSESGSTQSGIEALVEGPPAHIAFNTRFLLTTLGAIGTPTVVLEMHTAETPGIVRPASPEAHICVVMPMHIAQRAGPTPVPTDPGGAAPKGAEAPGEVPLARRADAA
jgi:DNA polymerase III sliding clamp (beta) subunit (PCNA family)